MTIMIDVIILKFIISVFNRNQGVFKKHHMKDINIYNTLLMLYCGKEVWNLDNSVKNVSEFVHHNIRPKTVSGTGPVQNKRKNGVCFISNPAMFFTFTITCIVQYFIYLFTNQEPPGSVYNSKNKIHYEYICCKKDHE